MIRSYWHAFFVALGLAFVGGMVLGLGEVADADWTRDLARLVAAVFIGMASTLWLAGTVTWAIVIAQRQRDPKLDAFTAQRSMSWLYGALGVTMLVVVGFAVYVLTL